MKSINELLNLDQQRFVVMGGLMASGKSTIVSKFEEVGYIVVCPDKIRVEVAQHVAGESKLEGEFTDKELMANETKVWFIVADRVKRNLKDGKSVIFDATQINIKARKQALQWSKECKVKAYAVFIECPVEIALDRNLQRSKTLTGYDKDNQPVYGRYVPAHVIKQRALAQVLPTRQEGFEDVYIIHVDLQKKEFENRDPHTVFDLLKSADDLEKLLTDLHENGTLKELLPSFDRCWGVDQENKNHNMKLHEHMINAAKYLQNESLPLFIAGLLHDVGKFDTKKKYAKLKVDTDVFKTDEKVEFKQTERNGLYIISKLDYTGERSELVKESQIEIDANAHYYEHHVVGAILARRELIELGLDEIADEVYEYILYHMDLPFQKVTSKKTLEKLIDKVGEKNIEAMIKLREADKGSSNGEKYFDEIHKPMVQMVEEILGETKDAKVYKNS
jgi:predicted kinase